MPRREETWLREMLHAASRIGLYIEGHTFDSFSADSKTVDAVVFQLMVVGEAAKSVSETTCQKYTEINWRVLKRMRDTIVHSYFTINLQTVWQFASEMFPALRVQLSQDLEAEYGTKN